MSDYIKREDALNACRPVIAPGDNGTGTIGLTYEDIKNLPAADVRENMRGEWVFEKGDGMTCVDGWYCSNCKHGFHTNVPYFSGYNFCPHCGADMRGDNDG